MKDLSHLPLASQTTERMFRTPDEESLLSESIARWLKQHNDERTAQWEAERAARAEEITARFWHSWGGMCSRKIAYMMAGTPEEPPDTATLWRFMTGQMGHDIVQGAVTAFPPDGYEVTHEVRCTLEDGFTSGRADTVLKSDDELIVLEYKTDGGTGYKRKIGVGSQAEGPAMTAVVQGSMNAVALGATKLIVNFFALENVSLGMARKHKLTHPTARFMGQWTLTPQQFTPIANSELIRAHGIIEKMEAHGGDPNCIATFVPHSGMPKGARITNPAKSIWTLIENDKVVDTGSVWYGAYCDYCPFQAICKESS